MATGSLSDTTQIYPGCCAFPLWNDRKLFKEEEALRHQSYLLLKLSLGLPFEVGSGWHFQSNFGAFSLFKLQATSRISFLGVFFYLSL